MKLLIWLFFIAINILLAYSNNKTRLKRIAEHNTKQIEHTLYATGYTIIAAISAYFIHSYTLIASLLFLHLSIFPVAYNIFKGDPLFYLSKTTDSVIDKLQFKLGFITSEPINIGAFIAAILLLIF